MNQTDYSFLKDGTFHLLNAERRNFKLVNSSFSQTISTKNYCFCVQIQQLLKFKNIFLNSKKNAKTAIVFLILKWYNSH